MIIDSSLSKVDELMLISYRLRRVALQSALGGMSLSIVGMMFASIGLLTPVAGAMAEEVIDVVAVLNGRRTALDLFYAAEREPRGARRRRRRHPAAPELVLHQRQVRVDFLRQIAVGIAPPDQAIQPQQETAKRSHYYGSSSRSLSRNPTRRRQRSVCLASARVPAGVIA